MHTRRVHGLGHLLGGLADPFEVVEIDGRPDGGAARVVAAAAHRIDVQRATVVAVVVLKRHLSAVGAGVIAAFQVGKDSALDRSLHRAMRPALPELFRIERFAPCRVVLRASCCAARSRLSSALPIDARTLGAGPSIVARGFASAQIEAVLLPQFIAAFRAVPASNAAMTIPLFRASTSSAWLGLIWFWHNSAHLAKVRRGFTGRRGFPVAEVRRQQHYTPLVCEPHQSGKLGAAGDGSTPLPVAHCSSCAGDRGGDLASRDAGPEKSFNGVCGGHGNES